MRREVSYPGERGGACVLSEGELFLPYVNLGCVRNVLLASCETAVVARVAFACLVLPLSIDREQGVMGRAHMLH